MVASKDSFRNGECIIKRVIATEGQEVDIDFDTGTVYVDGVACEDEYTLSVTEYSNRLLNDSTQSEEIKNLVNI